jgi:hypothetical protein
MLAPASKDVTRIWRKGPLAETCRSLKPNLMDVGGLRTHIQICVGSSPVPALSAAPVPLELGPFLRPLLALSFSALDYRKTLAPIRRARYWRDGLRSERHPQLRASDLGYNDNEVKRPVRRFRSEA